MGCLISVWRYEPVAEEFSPLLLQSVGTGKVVLGHKNPQSKQEEFDVLEINTPYFRDPVVQKRTMDYDSLRESELTRQKKGWLTRLREYAEVAWFYVNPAYGTADFLEKHLKEIEGERDQVKKELAIKMEQPPEQRKAHAFEIRALFSHVQQLEKEISDSKVFLQAAKTRSHNRGITRRQVDYIGRQVVKKQLDQEAAFDPEEMYRVNAELSELHNAQANNLELITEANEGVGASSLSNINEDAIMAYLKTGNVAELSKPATVQNLRDINNTPMNSSSFSREAIESESKKENKIQTQMQEEHSNPKRKQANREQVVM